MAAVPHPRTPQDSAHTADSTMGRAAAVLEAAYPDWRITAEDGRLVARHRSESFDARREQWGTLSTTVHAHTPQQMRDRLDMQQAFRRAEEVPE